MHYQDVINANLVALRNTAQDTLTDTCIHRSDVIKCLLVDMLLRLPYGTELSPGELINHSDKVLVVDDIRYAPTHIIAKVHIHDNGKI